MYTYSKKSIINLHGCHHDLMDIFDEVIKHFDCSIICGSRSQEEQDRAFKEGRSKVRYPASLHNKVPSMAVDAIPYPVDWDDLARMRYFAGFVMGIAAKKGISLRWGGNWKMDNILKDNKFNDYVHFELLAEKT